MKKATPKFLGFSAALALSVSALVVPSFAQTATTDPVGFITLNVYGGGSSANPTISLMSPTLTQPILWQGTITAISGTTITVGGSPWAANQFNGAAGSHYVEIVSTATPAISGTLADITATGANTITTSPATGAAIGDTIKIRKDVTIADVFGATNSAGLLASDDVSTADEILIYNGATASSYYFYTDASHTFDGWKDSFFADASGVTIAPSEGVVVKRKTAGNKAVVFTGSVKTGNTLMPVLNGLNVLGTASAKGITLGNSNLYTGNANTGVKSSDDISTADEIILYTGTTPATYYYYEDASHMFDGWKDNAFADASPVAIPPGTAVVLKRKGGPAFNWVLPSPTSF